MPPEIRRLFPSFPLTVRPIYQYLRLHGDIRHMHQAKIVTHCFY
ncbi:Uncharacterized protein dnm_039140 [Desulfonema magnum]|uniref:Uncharacterized protein n=1 Tax=Desulfonema magnum TaxID=45655 RepID=A0A975BLF5_9BACT|nr:Uncharacterized protein dnm_039140 [Desulfonema magnum]